MTHNQQPNGYADAQRAIEANTSRRAKRIAELERWVAGTQYDHLPDWFSDEVPLFERAPCIVYPVTSTAIASNVDLVFGEGRFPAITSRPDEDEADGDDGGLSEDESGAVDRLIAELVKQSRLRAVTRAAFGSAQGGKSVAVVVGARKGRVFAETIRASWCEPELDADGGVLALEVRYPYLHEWRDRYGQWQCEARLYRRRIDAEADTTFLPAKAEASGAEPMWSPDPARTVQHGLGFCPVVWYSHNRSCERINDFDGHAIHETLCDEIRAHDFALSQRHRAALYAGDPLIVEIGVEPGSNPGQKGRSAGIPSTPKGGDASGTNQVNGAYQFAHVKPARRKTPGVVWQYENPETKVEILTLPEGALKAIDDNANDIRVKLCESLAVVILDPENIKFASTASGKAIETLKQRQLDRCDSYRDDAGENLLLRTVSLLLRIVARLSDAIRVPGLKPALSALAKLLTEDGGEWQPPNLTLRWGEYFKPGSEDEKKIVEVAQGAHDAGLITLRSAVQKVARTFGIENVDAYLEGLEEEAEEKMKRQADLMHELTGGEPSDDGDGEGPGARAGGNPSQGDRGRGGAPVAAAPGRKGNATQTPALAG
jgi:hypothetical protein